jgi:hypothetical protein
MAGIQKGLKEKERGLKQREKALEDHEKDLVALGKRSHDAAFSEAVQTFQNEAQRERASKRAKECNVVDRAQYLNRVQASHCQQQWHLRPLTVSSPSTASLPPLCDFHGQGRDGSRRRTPPGGQACQRQQGRLSQGGLSLPKGLLQDRPRPGTKALAPIKSGQCLIGLVVGS